MPEAGAKKREAIQSPHDKFFKEVFGNRAAAADFFKTHLPTEVSEHCDWATLRLDAGSFVDEHLMEHASDLLYRVTWRASPLCVYCLFEHQSAPDPEMPLRLLRYMLRVWEQCRKQGQSCPPILPIVLAQGRSAWTVPTAFMDWLSAPAEQREAILPYQPNFRYVVVDLLRLRAEEIRGELVVRLALTLMKAVREDGIGAWLEAYGRLLVDLARAQGQTAILRALLRYLFHADTTAPSTLQQIVAKVPSSEVRENVMSLAEILKQEGRQEGLEEGALIGKIQACQELLGVAVSSVTELSQKEARQLISMLAELHARLKQRQAP